MGLKILPSKELLKRRIYFFVCSFHFGVTALPFHLCVFLYMSLHSQYFAGLSMNDTHLAAQTAPSAPLQKTKYSCLYSWEMDGKCVSSCKRDS